MQLLSLKVARSMLWNQCSSLPYDESNTSEVANVNLKINLACERFFSSGSWRGTLQRTVITAYDNQVTLPRELQTILAVKSDFSYHMRVHPIWYEFITGSCLISGASGLNDLGEGFCTFRDIPTDLPIVVRAAEDVGSTAQLTIILQNVDGTAQIDVPLNVAATQIDSPLTGKIIGFSKPVTAGRVEVYYVENVVEVKMAILKPSETDANYRRYRVGSGVASVDAICKRAFIPAIVDIEPIVPNNIGALGEMILAIQYRDKNDRERYKDAEAKAIAMADADRQQFDGDNQTPLYHVTRGFGAADIPHIGAFGYRGNFVPGHYPL
jgi:hypothetical protein